MCMCAAVFEVLVLGFLVRGVTCFRVGFYDCFGWFDSGEVFCFD